MKTVAKLLIGVKVIVGLFSSQYAVSVYTVSVYTYIRPPRQVVMMHHNRHGETCSASFLFYYIPSDHLGQVEILIIYMP